MVHVFQMDWETLASILTLKDKSHAIRGKLFELSNPYLLNCEIRIITGIGSEETILFQLPHGGVALSLRPADTELFPVQSSREKTLKPEEEIFKGSIRSKPLQV